MSTPSCENWAMNDDLISTDSELLLRRMVFGGGGKISGAIRGV